MYIYRTHLQRGLDEDSLEGRIMGERQTAEQLDEIEARQTAGRRVGGANALQTGEQQAVDRHLTLSDSAPAVAVRVTIVISCSASSCCCYKQHR